MAWQHMRRMSLMIVGVSTLSLVGCQGPSVQIVVRSILGFNEAAAVQGNHSVPGGFPKPNPSVCGGVGSAFLGELKDRTPDNAKVPYEWAPIVPSTVVAGKPTVSERTFSVAGQLSAQNNSNHDILFAHPFGKDWNMDVKVDAAYKDLSLDPTGGLMHMEIEQGLLPHQNGGLWPGAAPGLGDRVAVVGDWILDCGHPESYGTEIHPPTFLSFAHVEGGTSTRSYAFVNPYRVTQLYNPNETLANALDNRKRFSDADTMPFPGHLYQEIVKVIALKSTFLAAHVLIEPTDFGTVTWYVCAPSKQPNSTSTLDYSYHFTARSGVAIQAVTHADIGCVSFVAVASPSYAPAQPVRHTVTWPWASINVEAQLAAGDPTLNVLDKIESGANDPGVNHYFANDPQIDSYDPLSTLPDYANDNAPGLRTSDAQPFPFYGWATVSWHGTQPAPWAMVAPSALDFSAPHSGPQTITVTNVGSAPLKIAAVSAAGVDSASFKVASDGCSGTSVPVNGSCSVIVVFTPQRTGNPSAKIVIQDNAFDSPQSVDVGGPGLIA
jgi:hypothetical protein